MITSVAAKAGGGISTIIRYNHRLFSEEEDPIDDLFNNDQDVEDEEEGENLFGDDMERFSHFSSFVNFRIAEIMYLSRSWTSIPNQV